MWWGVNTPSGCPLTQKTSTKLGAQLPQQGSWSADKHCPAVYHHTKWHCHPPMSGCLVCVSLLEPIFLCTHYHGVLALQLIKAMQIRRGYSEWQTVPDVGVLDAKACMTLSVIIELWRSFSWLPMNVLRCWNAIWKRSIVWRILAFSMDNLPSNPQGYLLGARFGFHKYQAIVQGLWVLQVSSNVAVAKALHLRTSNKHQCWLCQMIPIGG